MRVIAGTAKSLKLEALPGNLTRPTTDRIRETLFNMIAPYTYGSRFLDLFSGSGAIAVEALSRGAKEAVLVERDRRAADVIRRNLDHTHLADKAKLITMDVMDALAALGDGGQWDIIFMDPPYRMDLEKSVMQEIRRRNLAGSDTLIIVEAADETDFSWAEEYGFCCTRCKEYKTNKHMFFRIKDQWGGFNENSLVSGKF